MTLMVITNFSTKVSVQSSINESMNVGGVNVYNGRKNYVIFHPREEDTGLVFRLKGNTIPASLDYAYHRKRAVALDNGKTEVHLVEHLMSAVYALGIDNLIIELSDGVCPTTDNCASEYFLALRDLRVAQQAKKKYLTYRHDLETVIRSEQQRKPDTITVKPSSSFVIDYFAYYPHIVVGEQNFIFEVDEETYQREIMEARSPAFLKNEICKSITLFLGRHTFHGLNGKNFLLITSKNAKEYANPSEFGVRYEGEEFVRHKVLDFLGTLALSGKQFKNTEFQVHMSGHKFDIYALKKLFGRGCFIESN